ncbi:EamA family transporter RarD [Rhodococcus aerolatus]
MGAGAYLLWGVFPAFFPLLEPAGPTEILAHRVVWTLVLMLGLLAVTGRLGRLRGLPRRSWLLVAAASALISVNWGTYILAVNTGRVVEASLGYFINPLVSVLLGVVVLRERLRRGQWVAVAIAAVAVVALTVDYGRPPVVALVLACSFGTYGLIKKTIPLDPRTSLTAEGLVAAPFAVAFLVYLQLTGAATFVSEGPGHVALLVVTGLVTAVPLLLFAGSAQRVPLVMIGILQYLTPVMQFLFGILVRHEDMPASRWFGFALIWTALVVFTAETVRHARRRAPDPLVAEAGAVT